MVFGITLFEVLLTAKELRRGEGVVPNMALKNLKVD
jgi:hypothetical protein